MLLPVCTSLIWLTTLFKVKTELNPWCFIPPKNPIPNRTQSEEFDFIRKTPLLFKICFGNERPSASFKRLLIVSNRLNCCLLKISIAGSLEDDKCEQILLTVRCEWDCTILMTSFNSSISKP